MHRIGAWFRDAFGIRRSCPTPRPCIAAARLEGEGALPKFQSGTSRARPHYRFVERPGLFATGQRWGITSSHESIDGGGRDAIAARVPAILCSSDQIQI
jgi:hypothetical protein